MSQHNYQFLPLDCIPQFNSNVQSIITLSVQNGSNILNLNCLNLKELPEQLFADYFQKHLLELHLKGNVLERLQSDIGKLKNLSALHMPQNRLSKLPTSFLELQNLTNLCVSQNNLSSLPLEFSRLTNLVTFNADKNCLSTLPHKLWNLPALKSLSLASNKLNKLQPTIYYCKSLQYLNLDSNDLELLPPQITYLPNLKELSLCNNKLREVPYDLMYLKSLEKLFLDSNSDLSFLSGGICKLNVSQLGLNHCGCLVPFGSQRTINEQYNLTLKTLCANKLCSILNYQYIDPHDLSNLLNIPYKLCGFLISHGHCFQCEKPFYQPSIEIQTYHMKCRSIKEFRFPGYSCPVKLLFSFCSLNCAKQLHNKL